MPFFNLTPTLQLFYTLHGSKNSPPLLLIHGWCCNSHDWDFQIPLLSKTYRVIAYDLRGHGHSSAPTDVPYKLTDHTSDAVALLKHLGYEENVVVVGHSMGGVITSALIVRNPELLKASVIVDPSYFDLSFTPIIAAYDAAAGDVMAVTLNFWPSMIGENVPEWTRTSILRRAEETPTHVIRGCIEGPMSETMGTTMDEHFELRKKRKVPRLVIFQNEKDLEKEKELGMGESDEVVVMGGVGHWMHQAKADEFNEVLNNWLRKIEA